MNDLCYQLSDINDCTMIYVFNLYISMTVQ